MPEGPEVRRIADKLRQRLKGQEILWIDLLPNTKYSKTLSAQLEQYGHLFPARCLEVIPRGKQIFFFFDNQLAFISSLGLEGRWYYFSLKTEEDRQKLNQYRKANSDKPNSDKPNSDKPNSDKSNSDKSNSGKKSYPKFALCFGKTVNLQKESYPIDSSKQIKFLLMENLCWYDDKRNFGNFNITDWAGAINKMKSIGPDLLNTVAPLEGIQPEIEKLVKSFFFEPVSLEVFTEKIRSNRLKSLPVCSFLMDQEQISGIGNYLKSEILYLARINPFRILGSLSSEEIFNLYQSALQIIRLSYQEGGLTHTSYLDPDMKTGNYSPLVYNRKSQYDRNGFPILYVSPGKSPDKRGTYYVPIVQPLN